MSAGPVPVQRKPLVKSVYDKVKEIKDRLLEKQKPQLDDKVKELELKKTAVKRVITTLYRGAGRGIGRLLGKFRGVGASISSKLGL